MVWIPVETFYKTVDEEGGNELVVSQNQLKEERKFDDLYIGIGDKHNSDAISVALSPTQVDELISSLTRWRYFRLFTISGHPADQDDEDD